MPTGDLKDYKAVGVHYSGTFTGDRNDFHKRFADLVPKDAEVVVGYRTIVSISGGLHPEGTASGTALIRR
jgi:hypothetical protein